MPNGERALSVAHLLAPAPFGGLETVVSTLAPAQVQAGADVTVCLVLTPGQTEEHSVARALRDTGVSVESWEIPVRGYREERARVTDLVGRKSLGVLHTHGYRPDVVDAPVARRMGVATMSTVHGRIGGTWKGRVYEWVQARAFRAFSGVIVVSEELERELQEEGVPADRVHLLPNAWEPTLPPLSRPSARQRLGLPEDVPVVGWLGRMSPEKAPEVLVRAAARVRDPSALYSFIGDGPDRKVCEGLVRDEGLGGKVYFHGEIPDASRFLSAFDVFVLSSWTEGTPMALLEAISAGVPVVTTAVGGIPAVVSEHEARLCEAGSFEEIARAIDDVLSKPGAARARALAAKERLETDFAVAPWAQRHLDLYRALVNGS
ncbi:MAG: glycosyltransferase [Gemmatimonadetes bacterium]|nr:glycosyltransferase [Gemmatimonadota bacterium]